MGDKLPLIAQFVAVGLKSKHVLISYSVLSHVYLRSAMASFDAHSQIACHDLSRALASDTV